MGVPDGHPFFGNQYTNGGYLPGSYSYIDEVPSLAKIIAGSERAVEYSPNVSSLNIANNNITKMPINNSKTSIQNLLPNSALGKAGLIITGITIAALAGVKIYKFFKNRRIKKIASDNGLCYFGTCTKCGSPLIESSYVVLDDDKSMAYVLCNKCDEKNFAYYPDEKDSSNTYSKD